MPDGLVNLLSRIACSVMFRENKFWRMGEFFYRFIFFYPKQGPINNKISYQFSDFIDSPLDEIHDPCH